MNNITKSLALVLMLSLPLLGHSSESEDARFENKESVLKELPQRNKVENRAPATKILKKIKARQEILRSNGRLERLYNFNVSL